MGSRLKAYSDRGRNLRQIRATVLPPVGGTLSIQLDGDLAGECFRRTRYDDDLLTPISHQIFTHKDALRSGRGGAVLTVKAVRSRS